MLRLDGLIISTFTSPGAVDEAILEDDIQMESLSTGSHILELRITGLIAPPLEVTFFVKRGTPTPIRGSPAPSLVKVRQYLFTLYMLLLPSSDSRVLNDEILHRFLCKSFSGSSTGREK